MTNMLQTDTNVTMSAPDIPPPTPAEARKALDAAFAEIGIVFKKKPIVIKECDNNICSGQEYTGQNQSVQGSLLRGTVCYHGKSLSSI